MINLRFDDVFQKLLSAKTQNKIERIFLTIAIASFLIHLSVICLVNLEIIAITKPSNLLENPIAAIYTPFSFLLVYEVYLLIYYLPRSLTNYVNKQYEIILLIIMRRLFKDLSNLNISSDWFKINYDLQFTYDIITSLLLFFLIYLFYTQSKKINALNNVEELKLEGKAKYIKVKKIIASGLVPIVLFIAIYSLTNWFIDVFNNFETQNDTFKNINNVFFEQFFSLLVIVDVLLLLVSFFYTDKFHKVIRNSGFIISTILIRLSFTVDGIMNNLLVVIAITFGLAVLVIHNKFEKIVDNAGNL
jgi:hypothetical protein